MRPSLSSVLLAVGIASTAAADKLIVSQVCTLGVACTNIARFYTDFGDWSVNGNDGCHGTPVPGMVDFCIDWSKLRGHFRFSHQSFKRCLGVSDPEFDTCGKFNNCNVFIFDEVPCTWRLPADDSYPEPGDEKIPTLSATLVAAHQTVGATLPGSSEPAEPIQES